MSSVLEKIDLPDPRDVVEEDVFAPLVQISHGAETGELPEVADQVRLVEEPAGHGPPRRLGSRAVPPHPPPPRNRAQAAVQLRRQADLGREERDEPPLAEADPPGEVANLHGRVCLLECVERYRYRTVPRRCLAQAPEEHFFQHRKSLRRRRGLAYPFPRLRGPPP